MTAKKPYIPDPDEFVTYARRDEDPTQQWLCDPRNDPDSIFYVPPPPVSESRVVVDPAKQYRPSPAVRARLSSTCRTRCARPTPSTRLSRVGCAVSAAPTRARYAFCRNQLRRRSVVVGNARCSCSWR